MPATTNERRKSAPSRVTTLKTPRTVDQFMAELDHPLKPEIEAVRRIVLDADPAVHEEVKWNAPSFRTTEFFATVHLRARDGVQVVFHTGAKPRDLPGGPMRVDDPAGLVQWLGKDRCLVTLGTAAEIASRKEAFQALVRQWIAQL